MLLCGCAGSDPAAASDSGNTLVVFNYGDYIDFTTIEMFEKETGIRVEYEQICDAGGYVYKVSVRKYSL